jgi:uncharacterized protein YjbI with pentapeptide repeats
VLPFLRPRLFLSYSSADATVAESLRDALSKRGFEVFKDSAEILAGEDFVERIVAALRRSDAVVSLQTTASAASEWCQAELHHAHALGVPVIPVRLGEKVQLVRPLELLQRRVHRIAAIDEARLAELPADLEQHLHRARTRRWRRVAGVSAVIAFAVSGLVLLAVWSVGRVNSVQQDKDRADALKQLRGAANVVAQGTLDRLGDRFASDPDLLKNLLLLREDSTSSEAARMNASLLSTAILERRRTEERWLIRDLDLKSLHLRGLRWTNMTFQGRTLQNVQFQDSTFAGVVWSKGLTISGLRCQNCDFWFTWFAGAVGVDLEFVNSSFRGSEIDLTNLSLFRLLSHEKRPELETLVTDEISVVENSVILNRNLPPAPGVLDLSVPSEEALFDGVVFSNVHFRGYIRPEWFRNCHFLHCVLPTSLSQQALEAGGNILDSPLRSDEPLD